MHATPRFNEFVQLFAAKRKHIGQESAAEILYWIVRRWNWSREIAPDIRTETLERAVMSQYRAKHGSRFADKVDVRVLEDIARLCLKVCEWWATVEPRSDRDVLWHANKELRPK